MDVSIIICRARFGSNVADLMLSKRALSSVIFRRLLCNSSNEGVHKYAGTQMKNVPRVYAWGRSDTGALGVASLVTELKQPYRHNPVRLKVIDEFQLTVTLAACGKGFSLFVTAPNNLPKLLGTGTNTDSQLGAQFKSKSSQEVLDYVLSPTEVHLRLTNPQKTNITSVACGRAHSIVVTDREGVLAFGHNGFGQCGRPVIRNEEFRASQTIQKIDVGETVVQAACGLDTSFLLTQSGRVFSFGCSTDGQTGTKSEQYVDRPVLVGGDLAGQRIVRLSCRGDAVLALSDTGELFGWGNCEYGQFLWPGFWTSHPAPKFFDKPYHLKTHFGRLVDVAAGGTICAALNEAGEVFVWGFGILGRGPQVEHSLEPLMLPMTLFGRNELNPDAKVAAVQAGLNFFAARTVGGQLYTWGKNTHGQLGLGHTNDQYFPMQVPIPAEVCRVYCGIDHNVALCRSWA